MEEMLFGAIEAGGTKMICAIGDKDGNIREMTEIPTGMPQDTLPEMAEWFEGRSIKALGIGCFGPVDLHRDSKTFGYITTTPKPGWMNCDFAGAFRHLGVPIGFELDVNASVIGEHTWGAGKGLDSLVYVTVGTGIGAGVIVENQILHGMVHPEAGHIFLTRHPRDLKYKGHCPFHKNCLEGLCCGPAVEERWGKKGIDLADNDEAWEIEGYYLAQMCANYALSYSPRKIILGGGIMHQRQLFPIIRRHFTEMMGGYLKTPEIMDTDSYIIPESMNDMQGVLGALKLGMDMVASLTGN